MAGKDAFGTAFQTEDPVTPGTFTDVADVSNITPPGIARDTIEVTSHGSPDGWKEYLGGLKDGGEVTIEVNYDPTKHDVLAGDLDTGDPKNYKIVFPGTLGEWAFTAVLTGFAPEAPVDDKLSAELTYQVSGKPTLTTAGV